MGNIDNLSLKEVGNLNLSSVLLGKVIIGLRLIGSVLPIYMQLELPPRILFGLLLSPFGLFK